MKTPSDALYDLIKSLSRTEKRYIKVAAGMQSKSGANNYIKLFNAIDKQKSYNEKALANQFKGEFFYKRFDLIKSYLYHFILRSLRHYAEASNLSFSLGEQIKEIKILFEKGLYNQSLQIAKRAQKNAIKQNDELALYKIFKYISEIIEGQNYQKNSEAEIKGLYDEQLKSLNKLINQTAYQQQKNIFLFNAISNVFATNASYKNFEEKFFKLPLWKNGNMGQTLDAQSAYFIVNNFRYIKSGNFAKSLKYAEEFYKLISPEKEYIKAEPFRIIYCLFCIIRSSSLLKKYDKTLKHINELKSVKTDSQRLRVKIFTLSLNFESHAYLVQKRYADSLKIVEAALPKIKDLNIRQVDSLEGVISTYFIFIEVYILNKKYSEALDWINIILNDKELQHKKDLLGITWLLNLIAHIELKNNLFLEANISTTERNLKKINAYGKFEKTFIKFGKEILHSNDKKALANKYSQFKKELVRMSKDSETQIAFEYFDFIRWVDNH